MKISPGDLDNAEIKKADEATKENGEGFGLKRTWGLWAGISLNIGVIIGSGIFISPTGVLYYSGSIGLSLVIWSLFSILAMCEGLCFAELSTLIGKSSGEFIYFKVAYGAGLAFMASFASTFLTTSAYDAILSITCSNYILTLFFNDDCHSPPTLIVKLLAVVLVLIASLLNMASNSISKNIQILFTVAKLLGIAIIVIGGIVMLAQGRTQNFQHSFEGTTSYASNIALAFYSASFSYGGSKQISVIAEEVKNPSRNIPLAVVLSILTVTVVYVMANISYYTVMTKDQLLASPAVGITWAHSVIPDVEWIIPLIIAVTVFGALNGSVISSGRQIYRISREGHLPSIFGMVHVTRFTPPIAIFLKTLLTIIYIIPTSLQTLIDMVGFTVMVINVLVYVAVILLRFTMKDKRRPFKVPIVIPVAMALISLFLSLTPLVQAPQFEYIYGLSILVGSLVFYFPFVHFKLNLPGMRHFTKAVQLFGRVARSEIIH